MKLLTRLGGICVIATAAVCLGAPAAVGANTIVVRPGHSIQKAINRANAGDTVLVTRGVYRQSLQVRKGITLKGRRAILTQPAHPAKTLCNKFGATTGICAAGKVDVSQPNQPKVVKLLRGAKIKGFTVRGFKGDGILGFGTKGLVVARNRLIGNGGYGTFSNTSTGTRDVGNLVKGNGAPGIYVGDSPSAHALVKRNRSVGNRGEGILLRNASIGRALGNTLTGNCAGLLVLADAPGPATDWLVRGNTVSANNNKCPGDPAEGEPPISGVGIALLGAANTTVSSNQVIGNRKQGKSILSGGIVVQKGVGGTPESNDSIVGNTARKNRPFDISWDGAGTATFTGNTCSKGSPPSIC